VVRIEALAFLVFSTVLVLTPTRTTAQAITGNQLYEWFKLPKTGTDATFADGYVIGVVEGTGAGCFPDGITRRQLRDIVQQYLENYPESRHLLASDLVVIAIEEKFPCPGKK
jgi:Rap1a immunity proteins